MDETTDEHREHGQALCALRVFAVNSASVSPRRR